LARAILEVADSRAKRGVAARHRVEELFSLAMMVDRTEFLLAAVTAANPVTLPAGTPGYSE
jgi:hypothetical protein